MKEQVKMKGKCLFSLCLVLAVLFSANASAFAVSCAYWRENPLILAPGETADIELVLQNVGGEEDISAKGSVTEGADIAKIIDSDTLYSIPAGNRVSVNIRVALPKDAEPGKNYTLKLNFNTMKAGEAGSFSFGSGIEKSIPVTVAGKAKPESALQGKTQSQKWATCLAIALVFAAIIVFAIRKYNSKK